MTDPKPGSLGDRMRRSNGNGKPPVFTEPLDTPTADWRYDLRNPLRTRTTVHDPLVAESRPGEESPMSPEENRTLPALPLGDHLFETIEQYLLDRHCVMWGAKFNVHSHDGRLRAIDWVLDLLDNLHEQMTESAPAVTQDPDAPPVS